MAVRALRCKRSSEKRASARASGVERGQEASSILIQQMGVVDGMDRTCGRGSPLRPPCPFVLAVAAGPGAKNLPRARRKPMNAEVCLSGVNLHGICRHLTWNLRICRHLIQPSSKSPGTQGGKGACGGGRVPVTLRRQKCWGGNGLWMALATGRSQWNLQTPYPTRICRHLIQLSSKSPGTQVWCLGTGNFIWVLYGVPRWNTCVVEAVVEPRQVSGLARSLSPCQTSLSGNPTRRSPPGRARGSPVVWVRIHPPFGRMPC